MPKMSQKKIDALVTAAFYRNCTGLVIPVMNLSQVMNAGRAAVAAGTDVDEAVLAAATQYAVTA